MDTQINALPECVLEQNTPVKWSVVEQSSTVKRTLPNEEIQIDSDDEVDGVLMQKQMSQDSSSSLASTVFQPGQRFSPTFSDLNAVAVPERGHSSVERFYRPDVVDMIFNELHDMELGCQCVYGLEKLILGNEYEILDLRVIQTRESLFKTIAELKPLNDRKESFLVWLPARYATIFVGGGDILTAKIGEFIHARPILMYLGKRSFGSDNRTIHDIKIRRGRDEKAP